jgi:hypothetical protein
MTDTPDRWTMQSSEQDRAASGLHSRQPGLQGVRHEEEENFGERLCEESPFQEGRPQAGDLRKTGRESDSKTTSES